MITTYFIYLCGVVVAYFYVVIAHHCEATTFRAVTAIALFWPVFFLRGLYRGFIEAWQS